MTHAAGDNRNHNHDHWANLRSAIATAPDDAQTAVTVIDLDTGETFQKDGAERFKSASTIKALVLAAVARGVDEGRLSLDTPIALPDNLKVGGSGVLNWLTTGIKIPLRDYAWLMIAISDNTASNICIEAGTIPGTQLIATELGLPDISLGRYFLGRSPAPGEPDNVTTANDLAGLLAAIETGKVASPVQTTWMRKLLAEQQHLNRLPRALPDGVSYAGKTGSIDSLVHDCGILTGPNGRLAVAVLTNDFPTAYAAEEWIGEVGRQVALTIA